MIIVLGMNQLVARLRKLYSHLGRKAQSALRHVVVTFVSAVLAVLLPAVLSGSSDWVALGKVAAAAGLAAVVRVVMLSLPAGGAVAPRVASVDPAGAVPPSASVDAQSAAGDSGVSV